MGSLATSRTCNPLGTCMRLSASSGVNPCANAVDANNTHTRIARTLRIIGRFHLISFSDASQRRAAPCLWEASRNAEAILGQQPLDHIAMHIGQAIISALEAVG